MMCDWGEAPYAGYALGGALLVLEGVHTQRTARTCLAGRDTECRYMHTWCPHLKCMQRAVPTAMHLG